jgi:hypothetical protein
MTLKKFVTYLNYFACLVFAIGFVGDFAVKHIDAFAFVHRSITTYLMWIGVGLMLPLIIYKDFHHKEFKKENKERWIHMATIIGLFALFIIIKEYVL